MPQQYDLIVIGAGPGGYLSAVKAAKLGKKVAVVEQRELGGTCLNRGCIPTKTLLHTSKLYHECGMAQKAGLQVSGMKIDPGILQERKREVIGSLRDGICQLFKKNKITCYAGTAVITGEHEVTVTRVAEGEAEVVLEASYILIAVGSKPWLPPIPGADLPGVVDSDALLEKADGLFQRLVIIGGGVIGMEFATIYSDFGCHVTVIEAMDKILPNMEKEISQNLKMIMKKRNVDIHTSSRVEKITKEEHGCLSCIFEEKGQRQQVFADGILISTGRRPNTENLFDKNLSKLPQMDRGYLSVDQDYHTSIPDIYAIGDVIGGIQLAHMATAEGYHAVDTMFGQIPLQNMNVVPSCVYTNPEIACIGITAEEAKESGIPVKTGKYIMSVNGKSLLSQQERGFIKLVAESETGRIIGAQLMCARATDMIGELGLAIGKGMTAKDLAAVIMAHPTFSEGVAEAAQDLL